VTRSEPRRQRILEMLATGDGARSSARLCEVGRDCTGSSGAGLMLMSGDVPRGSLGATDAVSGLIEDLQYLLGEGPCLDAYRHDRVVHEADIAGPVAHRWPAFSAPAVAAGVRAVFAFPVRLGAVRLGALDLYRDHPGELDADQFADALIVADVAARWVLDMQADAPTGVLAAELEAGADLHFVVHNAAGKVSVQAGVTITEALVRLRAHAFANERTLNEVAHTVVAGTLRFT